MLYSIMLFLHILGVVLMFVAVGITITAMLAMLHAKQTDTLRIWASLAVKMDGLLPFSVIIIFFPALYLVITTWGWQVAWINVSLAALLLMTGMGPTINLRRLKKILKTVNTEQTTVPSPAVVQLVRDPLLWTSVITMTLLAVAIVFLMTVKLALFGSLFTIVITLAFGYVTAAILLKKSPVAVS